MSLSRMLPTATPTVRSRRDPSRRGETLPEFAGAPERLVRGGAFLNAGALAALLSIRCFGRLDLDAMTLLPAAALAGAGAMSLGVALACLRALRGT